MHIFQGLDGTKLNTIEALAIDLASNIACTPNALTTLCYPFNYTTDITPIITVAKSDPEAKNYKGVSLLWLKWGSGTANVIFVDSKQNPVRLVKYNYVNNAYTSSLRGYCQDAKGNCLQDAKGNYIFLVYDPSSSRITELWIVDPNQLFIIKAWGLYYNSTNTIISTKIMALGAVNAGYGTYEDDDAKIMGYMDASGKSIIQLTSNSMYLKAAYNPANNTVTSYLHAGEVPQSALTFSSYKSNISDYSKKNAYKTQSGRTYILF